MIVHELAIVQLRPGDGTSGYLRESDLTPDTWAAVGWHPGTPTVERRVVIDLSYVVAFGAGTAEKVARVLVDAGVGAVQVEGPRKAGMRNAFTAQLLESVLAYELEALR